MGWGFVARHVLDVHEIPNKSIYPPDNDLRELLLRYVAAAFWPVGFKRISFVGAY